MTIPAPSNSGAGDFKRVPANEVHPAIIDQIIFMGVQRSEYLGKEKFQEKVYIRWQFPLQTIEYEKAGEQISGPMVLGRTYTYSFFENAHLGKMLTGLLGHQMTDEEEQTFNLFLVLGRECKVLVTENTASNGKTYSNIDTVMPCSQGLHKPEGPLVKFHPDFPSESNVKLEDLRPWLQAKVEARQHGEYDQSQGEKLHGKGKAAYDERNPPPQDDMDDDLPFS